MIHDHGEKRQEVGMDDYGGLEGTMGRKREETRGDRSGMDIHKQEKAKKTNGSGKKKGKRASRNYITHYFSRGGKATTKSSNNTTNKCNNIIK